MNNSKMKLIVTALINGRTINQWEHIREFKTTRLGAFVHTINHRGLRVESRPLPIIGHHPNPPVEYFCTQDSINNFLSNDKNVEYLLG